jgi:ABC-type nitrate/sulfonate/bicarbonate transport system permease component
MRSRSTLLSQARTVVAEYYSVPLLLLVWEIAARLGVAPAYFLPSVSAIVAQAAADFSDGALLASTGATLYRIALSYAAAILIGVPLGVAMARLRWVKWFFDPLISFGFPAPKIAFFPILVLWFGLGNVPMVVLTTIECIFPIVSATYLGTASVDRNIVWSAQNLGTRGPALLVRIFVPAALPQILNGLQVALPIAFIVMIVCEMLTGGIGLGGYLIQGYRFAISTNVFAGLFLIGLLGYGLMAAFSWLRRTFLVWHQEGLND